MPRLRNGAVMAGCWVMWIQNHYTIQPLGGDEVKMYLVRIRVVKVAFDSIVFS